MSISNELVRVDIKATILHNFTCTSMASASRIMAIYVPETRNIQLLKILINYG